MNDSITSTLFRLVSTRSPQRVQEGKKNLQFVFQSGMLQQGVFYDAIRNLQPGVTKRQALLQASDDFKASADILESVKSIQALNPELFEFSEWLIPNRKLYEDAELHDRERGVSQVFDDAPGAELQRIWDNLFYQTITQESFSVKEALMQILVANHLISTMRKETTDAASNRLMANGRVSLPAILFGGLKNEIVSTKVDIGPAPTPPSRGMKRRITISKAMFFNQQLETLRNELMRLERKYKAEYQIEYERAYKQYESVIEPILERYYADREAARKQFCEIGYNPDVPFNPKDPCQQPDYVPYPKLPDFEFNFRAEIDPDELERELSSESYMALLDISGYDFIPILRQKSTSNQSPHQFIADYADYSTIYGQIDRNVSQNNQSIIDNTMPANPQAIIGGITIPVTENTDELPFHDYKFCATRVGATFLYTLAVDALGSEIAQIHVTQHNSDSTVDSFTLYAPTSNLVGSNLHLPNFFSHAFTDGIIQNGPVFDFELHFLNGSKRLIPGINSMDVLQYCVRGIWENKGDGQPVPIETLPFIPSGYGVTQVGIADYLKVEQSIHCYIESEVSHIENVMAREYKEKSTRRLRRSEDTTTTSAETEREQLTDTTTADRFEMQSEISEVIQESKDLAGFVNAGVTGTYFINAGVSFANNTSTESSTHQAITQAREFTERALDRVVTKTREERVRKIVEEFEENNKHGFDNRKGNQHVVGVYRWVDKLYKNQIYNYGKRMMFEFMIPDPAKLHNLGMKLDGETDSENLLIPPIDPRNATGNFQMKSFKDVTDTKAAHWAGLYNAEIEPMPENTISVGKSLGGELIGAIERIEYFSLKENIAIPDGYEAISARVGVNAVDDGDGRQGKGALVSVGNVRFDNTFGHALVKALPISQNISRFIESVPVAVTFANYFSGSLSVTIDCKLSLSATEKWKQDTFQAIIEAYEKALENYRQRIEAEAAKAQETKRTNPGFYRQIENTILRKNCISYLIDQNPLAEFSFGKNFGNGHQSFSQYEINVSPSLDDYASFVKFMEQAFEWDIMSYNFYPFYWGPKGGWAAKYQFNDSDDPTFRAFIQAGMARVIVTVRPGFEEAVQFYLTTGQIWNGGQVPVVGDELYVDLIAEIQDAERHKLGKAWISRVPTALTILQARSIGLEVDYALPCNCDDVEDFENPDEVPCSDSFTPNDNKIGGDDAPEDPTE